MTLVIRVGGVRELVAGFDDLARTTRNRLMRIGLNAGGGVIRDEAVSNIPKDSGLLRKAMQVKVRVPDASFNVKHHGRPAYAVIGPARRVEGRVASVRGRIKAITAKQAIRRSFGGDGYITRRPSRYAHLLESGTAAHTISVRGRRVLRSLDGTFFGRTARHPGSRPRAFMSRAVREAGSPAKAKILSKIKEGIVKWAADRRARAEAKARFANLPKAHWPAKAG